MVTHVILDWVNVCSVAANWIHCGTQIMFAVGRLCTEVVTISDFKAAFHEI